MKRLHCSLILLITVLLLAQPPIIAQVMPAIQTVAFKKDTFDIVKSGAIAGGVTLCTQSINAAIDACHKNGGGTVLIPAGMWLTGPLLLQSNVNLHLAANTLLQFTTDFNQYRLVEGNWEGVPAVRNQSPLSASNAENIAVTGHGIIDGGGDAWRAVKKDKLTASQWKNLLAGGGVPADDGNTWYPSEKSLQGAHTRDPGVLKDGKTVADFDHIKDFLRPNLLVLTSCKRILLQGITFQNSPAWCLHPLMCTDLTVTDVSVKNPWYAQNGDGIDLESCKNVLLENNTFDVGDDGICIKSGRDAQGRKRNMPTENVTVRHCTVYHAHGGFVIGSEMSGGARNLVVKDCSFIGTDIGLRFKTTRGRGGIVENIFISDINMKDIAGEAILFDMYYMAKDLVPLAGEQRGLPQTEFKPVDETTPVFKNFHITRVYCNRAGKAIFIRGLPEMHVTDVVLENMVLQAKKGIDIQEASNIQLRNLQIITVDADPVIDVVQSNTLLFTNLSFRENASLLWRVSGDRVKDIHIDSVTAVGAKEKLQTTLGTLSAAVKME